MSIVIRPITEADAPAISDLVSGFAAQNLMLPRSQAQVLLALEDFLVADEAGRVVGNITLVRAGAAIKAVKQAAAAAKSAAEDAKNEADAAVAVIVKDSELGEPPAKKPRK